MKASRYLVLYVLSALYAIVIMVGLVQTAFREWRGYCSVSCNSRLSISVLPCAVFWQYVYLAFFESSYCHPHVALRTCAACMEAKAL